jgi:hypothetical protein
VFDGVSDVYLASNARGIKVKVTLEQTKKAQRGSRGIAVLCL